MENETKKKKRKPRKKSRVIPTEEVMKKFEEIYREHRYVFEYLKDK